VRTRAGDALVPQHRDEHQREVAAAASAPPICRPRFGERRVFERDDVAKPLLGGGVAELLAQLYPSRFQLLEGDAVRCLPDPEEVDDAVLDDATQRGNVVGKGVIERPEGAWIAVLCVPPEGGEHVVDGRDCVVHWILLPRDAIARFRRFKVALFTSRKSARKG